VGLRSTDGIVLAAEKRTVSKLLAPSKTSEKTATLDDHLVCLLAGLTSDANILIQNIRVACQQYIYQYQQPMPIEQAVKSVCNYKQSYTQFGGLRPFGVAFLFAGWDENYGFQLYQSDPSGNYSGWKATVIGQNNQAGKSILKNDYKEEEVLTATIATTTTLTTSSSSSSSSPSLSPPQYFIVIVIVIITVIVTANTSTSYFSPGHDPEQPEAGCEDPAENHGQRDPKPGAH